MVKVFPKWVALLFIALAALLHVRSSDANAQHLWEPVSSPVGFFQDRVQWDEEGTLYVQSNDSLYVSRDNGDNWLARPLPKNKRPLWQDATVINKNILFFDTGKVYCSTDRGMTSHSLTINDSTIDGIYGTLLTGTAVCRRDLNFYLTTDTGNSWRSLDQLDSLYIHNGFDYLSLSTNGTCIIGGATYGGSYIAPSVFGPWQPTVFYGLSLGTDGLVYGFSNSDSGFFLHFSSDAATSWDSTLISFALHPIEVISNGKQLYITTEEHHLLKGDASLRYWEDQGEYLGTIELTPNGTLFSTYDNAYNHLGFTQTLLSKLPIRRSVDEGQSWQDVGVNRQGILRVYSNDTILYLITEDGSLYTKTPHTLSDARPGVSLNNLEYLNTPFFLPRDYFGIHHGMLTKVSIDDGISSSADNGRHWSQFLPIPVPHYSSIFDCRITENVILLVSDGGAWTSTNDGAEWKISGDSLAHYNSAAITPDGRLWIDNSGRTFLSRDRGNSWSSQVMPQPWRDVLMESPSIYLLLGRTGSSRTTDDGRTWSSIQTPDYVYSGIYSPIEDQYYIKASSGIYTTFDHCETWDDIVQQDLDTVTVNAFALGKNDSLYIGTTNGLYRRKIALNNIPKQITASACRIYPSPASTQCTIVPSSSTEVRIYNSLGRLMYRAHARGSLTVNTACWPSGSYSAIMIDNAGKRESKTLIVQH